MNKVLEKTSSIPPRAIKVFGILNVVFGSTGLIGSICNLATSNALNSFFISILSNIVDSDSLFLKLLNLSILNWVNLFISSALFASGVGLCLHKKWARKIALGYGYLAILYGIFGMALLIPSLKNGIPLAPQGFVYGFIYPILLIYFLSRPNVKAFLENPRSFIGIEPPILKKTNKRQRPVWRLGLGVLGIIFSAILVFAIFIYYVSKPRNQLYCRAIMGSAEAQYALGDMYSHDEVRYDDKKAFYWYLKAAELGDARAQYELGRKFLYGKKNPQKACEWFLKAAEQGNIEAYKELECAYIRGKGVERNPQEALKWALKAAQQGDIFGQMSLGNSYYYGGKMVEKNLKEAFKWYLEAAQQGQAAAQLKLGEMYSDGEGVEKNLRKAFEWRFRGNLTYAEEGDPQSQYLLGNLYYRGDGVEKNYKIACEWFLKAANNKTIIPEVASAQYMLGLAYSTGLGVLKDNAEAYKWLLLAASNGDEEAVKLLDAPLMEFSKENIAEGERQAKQFKSQQDAER